MYWYLSFLRPPPVTISSTIKSITITPQVANDLRTEIRTEPTEIYFIWQDVSEAPSKPKGQVMEHLTTYRSPESTYKSIPIPLPPIRAGQSWRLGLFSTKNGSENQLLDNILSETVDVIGVWSEPISVTGGQGGGLREVKRARLEDQSKAGGKGKGKEKEKDEGPKQTRIQREWILSQTEGGVRDLLKIVEQTSFDLDKKIWDSGLALAAWLKLNLDQTGGSDEDERIAECLSLLAGGKDTRRILELGSGTGLVSIALRQYLARSGSGGHVKISATDLDSAMELMQENIALNETQASAVQAADGDGDEDGQPLTATLSAKTLDWDNPLPGWVIDNHPDVIIAADVTYNTSSFPSLIRTLRDLLIPKTGTKPPLLLAYKQRDEAERELWGMLKSEGVDMKLVDRIRGAEEDGQVEIWIGRAI